MSAFICSDRHITTIATAYAALLSGEDAQQLADLLLATNIVSVNYRYPNREADPVRPCSLENVAVDLSFPDLVALCERLDYQSCEPPDYSNPLLDLITAQFRANVLHGVKSALWSI